MASLVCSSLVLLATFFLLPWLYYLPKAVLASMWVSSFSSAVMLTDGMTQCVFGVDRHVGRDSGKSGILLEVGSLVHLTNAEHS